MTYISRQMILAIAVVWALPVGAQDSGHMTDNGAMSQMMSSGLFLPNMDAAKGRALFAS